MRRPVSPGLLGSGRERDSSLDSRDAQTAVILRSLETRDKGHGVATLPLCQGRRDSGSASETAPEWQTAPGQEEPQWRQPPSGDGRHTNVHSQPDDARRVVEMLSTAIPQVQSGERFGYDAIGVTVISCRNDGTPVRVVDKPPAPSTQDCVHYERMIRLICSSYRSRF